MKFSVLPYGFGVQTKPFTPAVAAPDVSNHVLPEHLHPEPDLRTFLERLTKTHEEAMLELRALRNDALSRAVNMNMAAIVRFDMARATPLIIKTRTLFNGLPALNVSVLTLGASGTFQMKTGDMGDADYITIAAAGIVPYFQQEEIEELTLRASAVGTGFVLVRLTAWKPSRDL